MIYQPSEDSFLLQETLKKYLNKLGRVASSNKRRIHLRNLGSLDTGLNILDLGSGSGIQALTCKDLGFKNILTSDINKESIKHLKSLKLRAIESNLFSKIKKSEKFDLIIFNPPYLPEDKREPKPTTNTTAGKKGYEIIIKFLKQATNHLIKNSSILLLFSSLSQPKVILKQAKILGYYYNLLNKKKLFFEELYVYEFKLKR